MSSERTVAYRGHETVEVCADAVEVGLVTVNLALVRSELVIGDPRRGRRGRRGASGRSLSCIRENSGGEQNENGAQERKR